VVLWQRYPRTSARGHKLQAKLSRNLRGFATTKSGNAAISYQLSAGSESSNAAISYQLSAGSDGS
jgi:hypothetical protein